MDPNQAAAEAAAAAVDPNSAVQQSMLGKITGRSHADTLNQETMAHARVVPGMDMEGEFAKKFEKALAEKDQSEPRTGTSRADQEIERREQQQAAPAQAQPAAPRDPLAPPKIGKHGHIRQLKEGIAAKEQSWEQEKSTLLKELETLKQTATPQLTEIMKENERLQREITLLDITKSPQFASVVFCSWSCTACLIKGSTSVPRSHMYSPSSQKRCVITGSGSPMKSSSRLTMRCTQQPTRLTIRVSGFIGHPRLRPAVGELGSLCGFIIGGF